MKQRLREGAQLIVVDPRRIELVRTPHVEAAHHLQLAPGTNVAVINALAHVIVSEGLVDERFVRERCDPAEFAAWAATELRVPCFLYGPERSLPEIRKHAFATLRPDIGPAGPHPTAGAIAVGARPVLVAYNLWLRDPDLDMARTLARSLRRPTVRTLALRVGAHMGLGWVLICTATMGRPSWLPWK